MLSPALKSDVQALIQQISAGKVLSPASLKRLNHLADLMNEQGYINYAEAYTLLFPKSVNDSEEKAKADKAFSKFRGMLQTVTEERDMPLVLRVDANKTSDNSTRHLWFECEDNIKQHLESYNENSIQNLPEVIETQNISIGDGAFCYLLIYAESEKASAHELHSDLCTQLQTYDIHWKMLDYHSIPLGENTQEVRNEYFRQANFILLMLSPKLIVELKDNSGFKSSNLSNIPLALKKITSKQLEIIALDECRVFTDTDHKSWNERAAHKKDLWVAEASEHIMNAKQAAAKAHQRKHIMTRLKNAKPALAEIKPQHFVPPSLQTTQSESSKEAIPYLIDWLSDPQGKVFCAIFGELGMGKTTLCQQLTRQLLQQRKHNPALPFPVYFDLRSVNTLNWNWQEKGVPPLDTMLENALNHSYNQAVDAPRISVEDIKRLAQEQGGLIIFDGLDEVMNRLTPEQSNLFIQQLWSILPPTVIKTKEQGKKHGRLMMSCRSHYFQTLQDQINSLAGQQRESIKETSYNWVTLLPLNDTQVESYFRQVFAQSPKQAERVISMLDQIHNLRELSNRPYNMQLIQQQVDTLEALQRHDKKVTVADLYEGMVGQWLQRDKPKHRLKLDHKLVLMESLALLLWRGQKQQIKYSELENWLTDQLLDNQRWQLNYQSFLNQPQGLDVLQQDLRNASFLVRHDDDSFRFAHTSIMEFFLARALYRALLDNKFEQWAILPPSVETLDFLAELIARDQTELCLNNMAVLRQQYQALASEVLLQYALRAYEKNYAGAVFSQFDLTGAKLKNLQIKKLADKPLNWMQANFSQADLSDAEFIGVNFSESYFVDCQLDRSIFDDCCLDKVNAQGASLIGTIFHYCTAEQGDFSAVELYRTQWLAKFSGSVIDQPENYPLQGDFPKILNSHSVQEGRQFNKLSFKGHGDSVTAVAYAPDGQSLASASWDNTVKLWDVKTGECQLTLKGHDGDVTAVAYAPDGHSIASACEDKTVKLWDVKTGACQLTLKGHDTAVLAVTYAPDGQGLASASTDNTVKLWDAKTGECQLTLKGHEHNVIAVAYVPDGQSFASAGDDNTVKLWNVKTGECQLMLKGHDDRVTTVAYAPDGQGIASASWDNTVKLWNMKTGECQLTLKEDGGVTVVAYAPDGQSIASVSGVNTVKLWDVKTSECQLTLKVNDDRVTAIAYALNGQSIASISDNTVKLWDAKTGECQLTMKGNSCGVTAIAYAPNGQSLVSASDDDTVKLWDVKTGKCQLTLKEHDDSIAAVAYAPDGQGIASASWDGTVKLWDAKTGECQLTLKGHGRPVTAVSYGPGGQSLASASWDRSVKLWDAKTGECQQALEGHDHWVTAVAYAPDGKSLASASEDNTVKLWDVKTGECQLTLEEHDFSVTAIAYAPDGQSIASASMDNTVKLWDVKTGECQLTLKGHDDWVTAVAYAPDGQSLVSASEDKTVKLWDAKTGECLQTLKGHDSIVTAVAYAPDGQSLVSAGNDGSLILWVSDFVVTAPSDKPIFVATLKMENLPEGNWVTWTNLNQPAIPFAQQHWQYYSKDAWRWLGWNAPTPDGKSITRYPMDYFMDDERL